MIKKLAIFFLICFGINSLTNASENNFFEEGKKLFDKENYEESKFLFQRSIVYDPKHANSYLYLGKIFKIEKNAKEEEKNINTALLLDPRNELSLIHI